jgi:hypothetical protein
MTPDERKAHHDKMRDMKNSDDCMKYMDEHHKADAGARQGGWQAARGRRQGQGEDGRNGFAAT